MTRIALVFGVALSLWASAAMAQNYSIGSIEVGNPWTRATPKGSTVAGGYMVITNKGTAPDRLVGGSAAAASRFEVHRMAMEQRRHEDASGRRRPRNQAGRDASSSSPDRSTSC